MYIVMYSRCMATMIRKQVYLRRDQDRILKQLARQEKRSEAELIRLSVDEYIRSRERAEGWERQKQLIDRWVAEAAIAGRKAARGWTREDAYDRKVFSRH